MMTDNPLLRLTQWVAAEQQAGNPFALGAVLATVSAAGAPRSRMLGTRLNENGVPRFHTAPGSRKNQDIDGQSSVSLTYAFQHSLRSVSLEGQLEPLSQAALAADWIDYDEDFRRDYRVFGMQSGQPLENRELLRQQRAVQDTAGIASPPDSFIGFQFRHLSRIAYYAVQANDFALADIYEHDGHSWHYHRVVP